MTNRLVDRSNFAALAFLLLGGCQAIALDVGRLEGQPVDVAPYGQVIQQEVDGKDYGVLWEDARDIFRVVVTFADAAKVPDPAAVRLQYWKSTWPEKRIPRDEASGAGSSGWLNIGDWFQGKWLEADAALEANGATWAFTFNPLNTKEFRKLKDFPATYRSTFKVRLVGQTALPAITKLEAYTDSTWQPLTFEIEPGGPKKPSLSGRKLEVFNGLVASTEPLAGGAGLRATILYAKPKGYNSFDETVVTLRGKEATFSFAAADLLKAGHIFIPVYGVIIRKDDDQTTYAKAEQAWREVPVEKQDVYTRVKSAPEQSLTQAWNDTPLKGQHHIPMSFEGGRQHFGLDEKGEVTCEKGWLLRVPGKDTERCQWGGRNLVYSFGLPASPAVDRHLLDGYLPVMVGTWEADGVRYRQTALVVPLMGVPTNGARIWADDTLVLMLRFEMERTGDADSEAKLALSSRAAKREALGLDGEWVIVAEQDPRMLRMRVTSPDAGASYTLAAEEGAVAYRSKLSDQHAKATLDVAMPFITLSDDKELAILRGLQFDEQLSQVGGYWRGRVAAGCRIDTPEPMINDFYRADVAHLLINTEREVGASDRYMPKVGTFHYGVFSNESCMMLNDLEVRGYPELVERSLNAWLHYQGTVALPGDFSTQEGVFYGDGGYEAGEYNQHHGWVLWMMGEHYWFTRDQAWLEQAAPKIIKGCDWVIQQRQRTIEAAKTMPLREIERGLMPPGRLEDIGDWRCWLTTNIYSWRGLRNAALALQAAGHPEGKRLVAEAEAYHRDLLAAYTEAMQRSPVVPLRDGSWVPHVPSDVHRRGRSFGWITETLEGAIHLVTSGAIEPDSPLATWIIQDFEDNLYLSEQYGYSLTGPAYDRYWFSLGGVSMQANLLFNPVAYLLRDEPQHFLRAYFNAFAVSYFADTRMMTEHALPNVGDFRGDHFKSSDESNSTYWLRCMFVQERGDTLLLGAAMPRYWLADGQRIGIGNTCTHFGPMSMSMESAAGQGWMQMIVEPPLRNPPKTIRARFRHPEGLHMTACEVDGQPYTQLDPTGEWVELHNVRRPVRIVAFYGGTQAPANSR